MTVTENLVLPGSLTQSFTDNGNIDRNLVGGKGFGLIEMTREGLTVPPGYVISTTACHAYLDHGAMTPDLLAEIADRLTELEAGSGKTFGAGPTPLLLSVRSGAPVSMPGMMDTVLNLGLGRDSAIALAEASGDTRFMAEILFRFHGMYADTVLGALDTPERSTLDELLEGVTADSDAGPVYDTVWSYCQNLLRDDMDEEVPSEPREQLIGAIEAVFGSWNTKRAVTYRELHKISHDLGTAVVVQSMVFGNFDENSGSGVVFTRNPVTGEPGLFGEFLSASQGEDVVAGTRTPDPVSALRDKLPDVYAELESICTAMEKRHGDVLDIEFTVERGILYMLQFRAAKRTAQAAIRVASDLLDEGVHDIHRALAAVTLDQVRQVQRPGFDSDDYQRAADDGRIVATGVGASPGQVGGKLYFDSDSAQEAARTGEHVILARPVTSPTDLHGMIAADGILTATGGSTSHAAVVARALGTTCVVGCAAVDIDPSAGTMTAGGRVLHTGDTVSLDGSSGEVIVGELELSEPAADNDRLQALLKIAHTLADSEIFARATTVHQVRDGLARGASGLVAGVDDVLATTGALTEVVTRLANGDIASASAYLEKAVTEGFEPLFEAAGDIEFGVRAIDFHAAETRELLDAAALFIAHPELSMPLGSEEIVSAQLRGIASAAANARSTVHFTVRKIGAVAEVEALRELRDSVPGAAELGLGSYISSPRGILAVEVIGHSTDVMWIELRVLQAAISGISAQHLLTREPLDSYVRRGLIAVDPRTHIDDQVRGLIDVVAAVNAGEPHCKIGIRLTGPVTAELLATLHKAGFRRFGVDSAEIRPAALALGQATC